MFSRIKPLIFLFFLLTPSLASLDSSYFYEEGLPDRSYSIHQGQITAISLPGEFQPIYHLDMTYSDGNKEHSCALFQRKLEFFSDSSFPLEKSLESVDYDKLLLLDRKLLLILDDNSMFYRYSFEHEAVSLIKSFDLKAFLTGSKDKSTKKLVFLNESQSFLAITDEKALGFKDLDDLSQNTLHSAYLPISALYTVKVWKNLLFIAGGSSGVLIYDTSKAQLLLKKQLSAELGVFTIYDARDLSIEGKTLLILDKNAGILFFSLENEDFEYLGTYIAFMNGESFAHKGLEVFYISGGVGTGYFAHEILYFQEKKSFKINKRSEEISSIKQVEIFKDLAFVLTGDTVKILYHSIPTEWVPSRFNTVNFIVEKGLRNFVAFESGKFNHLIGFADEKIVMIRVKEMSPQIYCGYGEDNRKEYAYVLTILSRNCPMKAGDSPFYSLCRLTQKIRIKVAENGLSQINWTAGVIAILTVLLGLTCCLAAFFFVRNRKEREKMMVEMEGIKGKFKYEEIVEEKKHSRGPSEDHTKENTDLSNVV